MFELIKICPKWEGQLQDTKTEPIIGGNGELTGYFQTSQYRLKNGSRRVHLDTLEIFPSNSDIGGTVVNQLIEDLKSGDEITGEFIDHKLLNFDQKRLRAFELHDVFGRELTVYEAEERMKDGKIRIVYARGIK